MPRPRLAASLSSEQRENLVEKLKFCQRIYADPKYFSSLRNFRSVLSSQLMCSPANISAVMSGRSFNPQIIDACYLFITSRVPENISSLSAIVQIEQALESSDPRKKIFALGTQALIHQDDAMQDIAALLRHVRTVLNNFDTIDTFWAQVDMMLADQEFVDSLPEQEYFRLGQGQQIGRIHQNPKYLDALRTLLSWNPRLTTSSDFFASMQGEIME